MRKHQSPRPGRSRCATQAGHGRWPCRVGCPHPRQHTRNRGRGAISRAKDRSYVTRGGSRVRQSKQAGRPLPMQRHWHSRGFTDSEPTWHTVISEDDEQETPESGNWLRSDASRTCLNSMRLCFILALYIMHIGLKPQQQNANNAPDRYVESHIHVVSGASRPRRPRCARGTTTTHNPAKTSVKPLPSSGN